MPTFVVAPAAFAASWFQSVETMAAARGVSALVLVQEWNADFESPSLQEVRNALHAIHCETDFSALYARFLAERFALFQSRVNKQAAVDADNIDEDALFDKTVRDFHWQQFLAEGLQASRAQTLVSRLRSSKLPFKDLEINRIEARADPVASF